MRSGVHYWIKKKKSECLVKSQGVLTLAMAYVLYYWRIFVSLCVGNVGIQLCFVIFHLMDKHDANASK